MPKTQAEIERINKDRDEAMRHLESARMIFAATECSLGAQTVQDCIVELKELGCDEY